ncbi:5'-tyrosyl-DNA phosphodiesterase [Diplogelasinospora grovesii]|uniref:5'-tyrosyl-DNA phosphodiesterase n=1 Tax=Diplogelasinospora grovesii TaxID=303347 RepID=A0AAN6ND20_9PEZI|nr:5'-tyrosyl-DNA phosphodiesterase [Diplogelasinospora grovesii]
MPFIRGAKEHPWTRGEPYAQPYYAFASGTWNDAITSQLEPTSTVTTPSSFTLMSWNIDFMQILTDERMRSALNYLHTLVKDATRPTVIMFNEMLESDLEIIQAQDWVQQDYHITDISSKYWASTIYGTCILIPKSLPIKSVFRVHYEKTNMDRDALFVDIPLPNINSETLRLCSTHLESLRATHPRRPAQLQTAAKFMHQADAAVLAGDLNAIQDFDKTLHTENNLKDAYLESGGEEGDEAGATWGQMVQQWQRDRYGLGRLDKMLFCGNLELEKFETFGLDVEVEDENARKELMGQGGGLARGWVTDHLGVRGDFRIITEEGVQEGLA